MVLNFHRNHRAYWGRQLWLCLAIAFWDTNTLNKFYHNNPTLQQQFDTNKRYEASCHRRGRTGKPHFRGMNKELDTNNNKKVTVHHAIEDGQGSNPGYTNSWHWGSVSCHMM